MFFRGSVEKSSANRGGNSRRRLPVLFCLDVSPSMRYCKKSNPSSIKVLKKSVKEMIKELRKIRDVDIEISIVTFSEKVYVDTPFTKIDQFKFPWIRIRGSHTRLANAILHCYKKIDEKQNEYLNSGQKQYFPYFILVTDGDPDGCDENEETKMAVDMVTKHCHAQQSGKEIIVPFIIGVGDNMEFKNLQEYSKDFQSGFFMINGHVDPTTMSFEDVFRFITVSINKRFDLETIWQIGKLIDNVKTRHRIPEDR